MSERRRKMMAWTLLICAGLLEIVWALALKHADGFRRLWPSVLGLSATLFSLVLFTTALRTLPVGTAYTVWVGIGAFGVAAAGVVIFGEHVSLPRAAFLGLILVGVIGLRVLEQ
jgi:quaternary ammonium compound-resistance protein SugE